jgi:excisionase family DNA binding protein
MTHPDAPRACVLVRRHDNGHRGPCGRETDGLLCGKCTARTAAMLGEIPDLVAQVSGELEPGRGSGTRRRSDPHAPIPIRLAALDVLAPPRWHPRLTDTVTDAGDQTGGRSAVVELGTWQADWRHVRGLTDGTPADYVLTASVRFLVNHLPWAAEHHPAVDEFVDQIVDLTHRLRLAARLDDTATTLAMPCPVVDEAGRCGGVVSIRGPVLRCDRCRSAWTEGRWRLLAAVLDDDPTVTVAEASRRTGLPYRTVQAWVRRGVISSVRCSGQTRIWLRDLPCDTPVGAST